MKIFRSFRFLGRAFVGVDPKGYRAVVDERNGHVGAKNAGFCRRAERAEFGDEEFVKAFRRFRRGRVDESGPVAFDAIAEEGELADDERGAADLRQVEVHTAFGVVEDAERDDFFRQIADVVFVVADADAEQDEETAVDLSGNATAFGFDRDARGSDALNASSHNKRKRGVGGKRRGAREARRVRPSRTTKRPSRRLRVSSVGSRLIGRNKRFDRSSSTRLSTRRRAETGKKESTGAESFVF